MTYPEGRNWPLGETTVDLGTFFLLNCALEASVGSNVAWKCPADYYLPFLLIKLVDLATADLILYEWF